MQEKATAGVGINFIGYTKAQSDTDQLENNAGFVPECTYMFAGHAGYSPPVRLTGLLVLTFRVLHHLFVASHDPEEPPLIQPRIPLVGHVIGLLRNGNSYHSNIAKKCGRPIFTLGLPRGKMYIVISPDLVTACDRRAKIVSFAPYVVAFAKRILAAGQDSIRLLSEDLLEDKGTTTLRPETMKIMHQVMIPGDCLDELMQTVLNDVSRSLDTVITNGNQAVVPMFQWIRSFVGIASTNAIYGSERNPMKDPAVMDGFWAVDKDFALLGLEFLPGLIASAGNRGRERFFDAFRKYYATDSLQTASHLIKARYEVNRKHGVSDEDVAHFDLGVCTALLVNTVPAVWWTLYHVFSDEALLVELRRGIEATVSAQSESSEPSSATSIDVPHVIKTFPLLDSFVKEVLRVHSNSMSARFLLQDKVIEDDKGAAYLLKKGSFLAMPSARVHASSAAWGPNASTFDPARFLHLNSDKVPKSAYRAFGGGHALCPGRHFAMNEIMSILIIMVIKYDVAPLDSGWEIPETRDHISTSVTTPAKDFLVRIQPRKPSQYLEWDFTWEPKKRTMRR
ncbi:cytochrome P450 [Zopfia rhizophila CBS 207.26]|uniref:Cytochrome P450 n=1 Tax=Zopfia rhizophila CBS 207.26 TaxID=1314779 RepID=A0A6A6DHP3_9PEZI|nr:cytochrome P450 [Zopfia rhizophila CBS 207.26]